MAIAEKTSVKAQLAHSSCVPKRLKAHERRDDLLIPHVKPLPLKIQSRQDRNVRLRRLRHSILGPDPVFPGTVIVPNAIAARLEDWTRIQDLGSLLQAGIAQVYWVDGSDRRGFLGAGIVWRENDKFYTANYQLGPNTGGSCDDTELFAIAAALGQAKQYMQKGNELKVVRVFSDALTVLDGIKSGEGRTLGPMITKKTALKALYARAYWLKHRDVCIELMWVKGHSKSKGNVLADQAASHATLEQIKGPCLPTSLSSIAKTEQDVPQMWRDLGPDWIDEWLWRANRKQAAATAKRTSDTAKQTAWMTVDGKNSLQPTRLLSDNGGTPIILGPSRDDLAAVELHNSLQDTRQAAIEAFYSGPPSTRIDSRLGKLLELRQKLRAQLLAVSERSSPSYAADTVAKAVKLEEQIKAYQIKLVTRIGRQYCEQFEQKRLSTQVVSARGENYIERQERKVLVAAIEGPEIVEISKSDFLKSVGAEAHSTTWVVHDNNPSLDEPVVPESWIGDTLLHLLEKSINHNIK